MTPFDQAVALILDLREAEWRAGLNRGSKSKETDAVRASEALVEFLRVALGDDPAEVGLAAKHGITPYPNNPGRWLSEHRPGLNYPSALAAYLDKPPVLAQPTDEDLEQVVIKALQDTSSPRNWDALTYSSGPYEITKARPIALKIAREAVNHVLAATTFPKHQFWGAGEPDCPPELLAPNGELHTLRCKVCGDGWRKTGNVCLGTPKG